MKRLCMILAGFALVGITACEDDPDPIVVPPPPEPTILEVVTAVPSTGTVGDQIALVLRARTPTQKPVAGKAIALRIDAGGGTVAPATVTTDSAGRATATWTLGQAPATNTLTATLDTMTARVSVATSPARASRISVVSGNNQSGGVTTALSQPISVRVTDRFNNPTSGSVVTFTTADGGTITPASTTSNAQGIASAAWVLGPGIGTQRAIARVDTASVTITATATGGAAVSGVIVLPTTPIVAGDSVQLQFRSRDQFGNETTTRIASYTTSNPDIATITSTGGLRGITAGTVTILAQLDQATATATVTIQPFRWQRIDAGNAHTCGIAQVDSRLYCWGEGGQGSTGTGTLQDALIPTAVSGSRTYTRVAAGLQFTCAIGSDSRAYCFGNNGSGQTGSGIGSNTSTPQQVTSSELFRDISTGVTGACALSTSGRPICWGAGQLPSDFSNNLVFSQIAGAPGGGHACGLTGDGIAYCWGRNNWGQLGNNSTTDSGVPVQTFTAERFIAIAVGEDHTCGLSQNGPMCWGRASNGQLGSPLISPVEPLEGCPGGVCRRSPTFIEAGTDLVTIDAYQHSTCGVSSEGEIWCWGVDNGNLGNNVTLGDCPGCDAVPTRTNTAIRFSAVTVGGTHSCGILRTGDIYCWGGNDFGQLGRNTRSVAGVIQQQPAPVFAPRR
jgi:alpha-tubulin suppressor-like RCC1 family protein